MIKNNYIKDDNLNQTMNVITNHFKLNDNQGGDKMANIYLKVPTLKEIHYRQEWMKDPKTMNYNAGYDIDLKGYDKETGTISKTDEEMMDWYNKWVNKEPDRFYAYIYSEDEKEPIGEVYYYPDDDIHSMGILIDDKFRGRGYSYPALIELQKVSFKKNNINELSDMIPLDRIGAIKTFKKAGFIHTGNGDQLLITKNMYLERKQK